MTEKTHLPGDDLLAQHPSWTLPKLRSLKLDPDRIVAGSGFLRRGAATLLTGGTGIGKSVLVEQWAICLAAGKPLTGGIRVRRPVKVAYVGSQNDEETLKRDCGSIQEALKVRDRDVGGRLDLRYVPGMTAAKFFDLLEALLERTRPDVVIVDPYQDFVGVFDINATPDFFAWRTQVDQLIHRYRCSFLTLPHTPKATRREEMTDREMVGIAAGTLAIGNWCRTACELLHEANDRQYCLHFSKNAERTGLLNEFGEVVRSVYVEHSDNQSSPWWKVSESQLPPARVNMEAAVVKAAMLNPEMSIRQLSETTKIPKTTVARFYPMELRKKKEEAKFKKKVEKSALSGSREAPARSAPGCRSADSPSKKGA